MYIYIASICGDSLAGYQQAMTSKQWGDRVETPLRPLKMGISHSNQLEKRTWTTDGRTTGNLTLDGFQHDSLLLGVFWDWTGLSHPPTKMPLELSTGNGSTHHEEQRSDFHFSGWNKSVKKGSSNKLKVNDSHFWVKIGQLPHLFGH